MARLTSIITSPDAAVRDQSLDALCADLSAAELLAEAADLDAFRRRADNLYERVRALFFLYAIHRFHLPLRLASPASAAARSLIPFKGFEHLLQRRFEEAIEVFLKIQHAEGPSDAISSALAAAYHRLGLPDAGRPGAPQRALGARQPMDVSHGPSRRPAAAPAARTAAARPDERRLPDPARAHAGAHGSDALRLERHFLPRHGFSRRAQEGVERLD